MFPSTRLLDMASYAHNPYAWPLIACALVTLAMGMFIAVREHGSRVSVIYLFQTLAISVWFLASGVAFLAVDAGVADSWFRVANIGVVFIPAIMLQFTWAMVRPIRWPTWLPWTGWVIASAYAVAGLVVPAYFGPLYRYFWGYYPHYTAISASFIPILALYLAAVLKLSRVSCAIVHPNSNAGRRARLLLIVFMVGSLGAVDFLPTFGVNVYPFGYLPVLASIALATYITARYRLTDITPEYAAKQILETVSDGLLLLDGEGVMRVVNDTLLAMIGLPREAVIGRRIPRTLRGLLTPQELASIQAGVPMHNREIEYVRRDGRPMNLSFTVSVIRGYGQRADAYVCAVRDITEQKHIDQRIRFLAYYDNLTGLPNRQQFQEELRAALAKAARHQRKVALLFLDIDRFKRINDTLGHALGDSLLQAVAGRVVGCVRKMRAGQVQGEDTVARLGGDEFIVGLYDLDSQDDAARVAERILASISEPMRLDQHEISVTASLGISVYPRDGTGVEALLKNADAAMYQAKEAGRNNFFFYDRAHNVVTFDRLSLENRLRKALELGRLSLHYQPQVATHDGSLAAVEALLRWHDPDLGAIPPARFIPVAEESGLILPIGEWVLHEACTQIRAWRDAGLPPARIAVNLSVRQFRDRDLIAMVRRTLDATGLEPRWLEFELTEGIVMQDALHTQSTLGALKELGVRLSIDDFGMGYSSLSSLRGFSIDALKIDHSFVHDIGAPADSSPIVAAIVAMARSLNVAVVGEGVETEAQSLFLKMHGCAFAQGSFYCGPLPARELATWLRARRTPRTRSVGERQ